MNKPFISYAQNGEDVVIWRCLSDVEGGYFVDVGAADPVGYSSTYCLYQAGWRGINIEPEPNFARALKALRPADTTVATAVGSEVGELELLRVSGTGLSTFNLERAAEFVASGFEYEPIKVPVTTLDILLAAHATAGQQIHLLKIDVEGFERQALNGLDLNVWRPWVVVVEATEPMSEIRNHDDWEALLTDNGYQCKLFDGLNRYYLAEEHKDRSNRLDHGPCIFDEPLQRAEVTLAIDRHRESITNELDGVRSQLAVTEQQLLERDKHVQGAKQQIDDLIAERERKSLALVELQTRLDELADYADLKTRERAIVDDQLRIAQEAADGLAGAVAHRDQLHHQLSVIYDSESWKLGRLMWHLSHKTGLLRIFRRPFQKIFARALALRAGPATQLSEIPNVQEEVGTESSWSFPVFQDWEGSLAPLAGLLAADELPDSEIIQSAVDQLGIDRDDHLLTQRFSAAERSAVYDLQLALVGRQSSSADVKGLLIDGRCLVDERFSFRGIGRHARKSLGDLLESVPPDVPVWLIADNAEVADSAEAAARPNLAVIASTTPIADIPKTSHFVSLSPSTAATVPHWIASDSYASALVYDLIPFQYPHHYFADPTSFISYVATLVWLRHFDEFWAISAATADTFARVLGIDRTRINVTGVESEIGVCELHRPPSSHSTPGQARSTRVLVCGGSDARKNLLEPLLGIRRITSPLHIEIVGVLPANMSDELLAALAVTPQHSLTVLGAINEAQVTEAYLNADLVIMPSWAEGFSLPVVEAAQAGRPVLAAAIPAHEELLGSGPWLAAPGSAQSWFDGFQRFAISGSAWRGQQGDAIAKAVTRRDRLVHRPEPKPTTTRSLRSRTPRPPRLAIISPLPAQRSGIADYSVWTLRPLLEKFDVSLVATDLHDVDPVQISPTRDRTITTSIAQDFDHVLHIVGNSHFHIPTLEHLERFGGATIAHDNRMTDVYSHWWGNDETARLLSSNGDTVRGSDIEFLKAWPDAVPNVGYRNIARRSAPLFVHSRRLAERIHLETGTTPVVLPFCPYRVAPPDMVRPRRNSTAIKVGTFGEVSALFKRHDLILEAIAWLDQWGFDASLLCVGHAEPNELNQLDQRTRELGIKNRVIVTGRVDDATYRRHLSEVDVAVQLRNSALQSLSGAVVDAIGYGIPLVTTDSVTREIVGAPDVHAVPDHFGTYQLATAIEQALDPDPDGEAKRWQFLADRTPENYCRLLINGLMESSA